MEARVSALEAIIPMLATREDLAKHETATQAAIIQQTWKIIAWVTGVLQCRPQQACSLPCRFAKRLKWNLELLV